MTIQWPINLCGPERVNVDLTPRSARGPATAAGAMQVVSSSAGIWRMQLHNVALINADAVVTYRAIAALLDGMANPILIPLGSVEWDEGWQPKATGTTAGQRSTRIPYSDGAYFSDGSGFVNGLNRVLVSGAVSVGATTVVAQIEYAGTILPGHHFSVGERMYRVRSATYLSDTSVRITFTPPARDAMAVNDLIDFDQVHCRMRLASDREMDAEFRPGAVAYPTVSFIEDV